MSIKLFIGILAGILTVVGYYPYFRDILKKKTTPHLYSWLIWLITQGTATVALLYGGGNFGATGLVIGTVLVFVVFILSFKFGTKNITRGDTVLLISALLAIVAWWLLKNPIVSVFMVTIIDAIGFIPTIRKSYKEPWSETLWFWAVMIVINVLTLAALDQYNYLTVTYSVMLFVGNSTVWAICLLRRKPVVQS